MELKRWERGEATAKRKIWKETLRIKGSGRDENGLEA